MKDNHQKEIDLINHKSNEELRALYDKCINKINNYLSTHYHVSDSDKNAMINQITHEFKTGVTSIVNTADSAIHKHMSQYFFTASSSLAQKDIHLSYETHGLSPQKNLIIETAVNNFRNEITLAVHSYTGAAENILKDNTLPVASSISTIKEPPKGVEKLCFALSSQTTEESYMLISTLMADIPEIMGFEVSVAPHNKHGQPRHKDICDDLAGEYPKGFIFRGWHYNCRCNIHPIIPEDLMTPTLQSLGFKGRPRGMEIKMSATAIEHLSKIQKPYSQTAFGTQNPYYVNINGEPRFIGSLNTPEALKFHIEEISHDSPYLAGTKKVKINFTEMETDVFMSTHPLQKEYLINMRESSGHALALAFAKKNLHLPLSPSQIEVTADILHELTHTKSQDLSMKESLERNINRSEKKLKALEEKLRTSPNLSETEIKKHKQKISKERTKLENRRNTIIDYHTRIDPKCENALEMLVEWDMRESYPAFMQQNGFTLPADYKQYINRGYNNEVTNFSAFIERIPPQNIEKFKKSLNSILRHPDKAFTLDKLTEAVKKSGALTPGTNPVEFMAYMQNYPSNKFSKVLKNNTLPLPEKPQETNLTQNDASSSSSKDIKKNQLLPDNITKNIIKGTLATGAISLTANAASQVIDPERDYSEKRYVPQWFYKDSYVNSVIAGAMDRAVNSVEDTWVMAKDLAIYAFYNTHMPFSDKTREMHKALFSSIGEVGEFMFMYQTNIAFKLLIDKIITDEIKNYLGSLWGTSPEHGYALGKLLFDVVSMFFGPGEIKAVITGFKTTKTGIAFQRVIKTNLDSFFELVDKHFKNSFYPPETKEINIINTEKIDKAAKKTKQYIKVNAYKVGKKINQIAEYSNPIITNEIPTPQVSSLITSNADEAKMILESIDDITQKHVVNIDKVTYNKKKEKYEFTGGHTINAAENFINLKNQNPNTMGYSYTYTDIVHENGVISRRIEITDNHGNIITKRGNNGYSSLYPASWSQEKINQGVKSALNNIIHVNKEYNIYTGISNEKIKIQFIIVNNTIISHYPLAN